MQVLVCLCAQITSGTPLVWHFIEYQRQDVSRENIPARIFPLRNDNLKLNCESTRICILLVFLEVKSPQAHPPPASHFHVLFPFNSTFCFAFLSCIKPVETLHFAFRHVYLHSHVPPNNPLNAPATTLF